MQYPYRRHTANRTKKWRRISSRWNNKMKTIKQKQGNVMPLDYFNHGWKITKSWPPIIYGENDKHRKSSKVAWQDAPSTSGNNNHGSRRVLCRQDRDSSGNANGIPSEGLQTDEPRKHIRVVVLDTTPRAPQKRRTVVISGERQSPRKTATAKNVSGRAQRMSAVAASQLIQ